MHLSKSNSTVQVRLETPEDVWFWQRRFHVFDFLELFPAGAISAAASEGENPPPAAIMLTFDTDAGFSFETDIVRGGFYLRNQSQGTRKWMSAREVAAGDAIQIRRLDERHFELSKIPAS